MKVKRIVANVHAEDIAAARRFYAEVLGLDLLMDHGWIATYGSPKKMSVQISISNQGGSGTPTRKNSHVFASPWNRVPRELFRRIRSPAMSTDVSIPRQIAQAILLDPVECQRFFACARRVFAFG